MAQVVSFDLDLPAAFRNGGPLVAALEILRSSFGWEGPAVSNPQALLAELQRSESQSLVEWSQDAVLPPAECLVGNVQLIAAENQSAWQAAQISDGMIELGRFNQSEWQPWAEIDLAELLCRLLATEAVVGHGPCLCSPPLPRQAIQPFELLPPIDLGGGEATVLGVVATARWFGVTTGNYEHRYVFAAPIDRARLELVSLAPDAFWHENP